MTDLEYNEPLEAKVVRLYIMKGYLLSMFPRFKVCSSGKASEVLNFYKVMKHGNDYRPEKWVKFNA